MNLPPMDSLDESLESLTPVDIGADEESLKKLLETLKILTQFQISFDDQRAVCQAQVKTLIDECGVALDARYPIQSFTQQPTPQNLNVVTEGVLDATGKTIAAMAKKVWAAIVAVCKWIMEALRKLTGREKKMVQRHQVVVILHAANAELKSVLGDIPPPPPPVPHEKAGISDSDYDILTAAMAELTAAEAAYRNQQTALRLQMLSEGPALGLVKGLSFAIPNYVELVGEKTQLVNGIIADRRTYSQKWKDPSDEKNTSKYFISAPLMSRMTDAIPLNHPLEVSCREWYVLHGAKTYADYIAKLKEGIHQLHDEHPKGVMEWPIAVKVVIDPRSGLGEPLLPLADKLYKVVEKLEETILSMHTPDNLDYLHDSNQVAYESMMRVLMTEIRSLTDYAETVNVVLDTQLHLITDLYRCEAAEFALHRAMAKSHPEPQLIELLNRIQGDLRRKILLRQE